MSGLREIGADPKQAPIHTLVQHIDAVIKPV